MEKYTIEYCKLNKVAIRVSSVDEYEQIIKLTNSQKPERPSFLYQKVTNIAYATLFDCGRDYDIRIWSKRWYYLIECDIISFEQFMSVNNKFTPPNKWYTIPRTQEEKDLLLDFVNKTCHYSEGFKDYINSYIPVFNDLVFVDGYIKTSEKLKNYTQIPFEDFKTIKLNQKHVIGYKLNDEKFIPLVEKITGISNLKAIEDSLENLSWVKDAVRTLNKYNLLDLLFTPVYEKTKEVFKTDDWVVGWFNDSTNQEYDKIAWQIGKIQNDWVYVKGKSHNCELKNIRKATQEEINLALKLNITLSNGKPVRLTSKGLNVEGYVIQIKKLKKLLNPNLTTLNNWDVEITNVTYKIGCYNDITKSDIQLIINTFNQLYC